MNTLLIKRLKKSESSRGFIRTIIIIVIALLILSYFGFNIRAIVNSPAGQDNFTYTQEVILNVWNGYLKRPATYLWNDIFLDLIWNSAIDNLNKIKDGQPDSIASSASTTLPMPQLNSN